VTGPDWKTDTPEKREIFTRFINERLDEEDDRIVQRFARIWLDRSGDPGWASKAREQFEAERLVRKHGGTVAWLEDKRRRGKPNDAGPLARAARDVRRIRLIFKTYWPDKSRRITPPSAEAIAAKRWNLSDEETTQLQKRIQRND
jgi:hypothetical protein